MFALIYQSQENVQYMGKMWKMCTPHHNFLKKIEYSSSSHPASDLLIRIWKDLAFQ